MSRFDDVALEAIVANTEAWLSRVLDLEKSSEESAKTMAESAKYAFLASREVTLLSLAKRRKTVARSLAIIDSSKANIGFKLRNALMMDASEEKWRPLSLRQDILCEASIKLERMLKRIDATVEIISAPKIYLRREVDSNG